MIPRTRRDPCPRDGLVVAAVDELDARAVALDRVKAARRAVAGEEHDASATERFGEGGDRAPVVAVARGAEGRPAKLGDSRAQHRERDQRIGWKPSNSLHALMQRPRAAEHFERGKAQPLLLVLHADHANSRPLGEPGQLDDRGRNIGGHRSVKGDWLETHVPGARVPEVPRAVRD